MFIKQATDTGGKSSQTIVEVTVIPGPNTRSPIFSQPVYDLQVSEGASINSTVATIIAVDPEKDPVMYSILTGNDLRQFAIGYKSGIISVIRKLDREDLTRYQLVLKSFFELRDRRDEVTEVMTFINLYLFS